MTEGCSGWLYAEPVMAADWRGQSSMLSARDDLLALDVLDSVAFAADSCTLDMVKDALGAVFQDGSQRLQPNLLSVSGRPWASSMCWTVWLLAIYRYQCIHGMQR